MRTSNLLASLILAAAALPGTAAALTCYTVLDRNENVIYRDTYPPVDMSDQGNAERQRMRARGEHLVAMEVERCPGIEFFIGNAGSTALNVDQVIAGMPVRSTIGAPAGNEPAAAAPASAPRGTPALARPAAPAKR
jgi:hypothetical protein